MRGVRLLLIFKPRRRLAVSDGARIILGATPGSQRRPRFRITARGAWREAHGFEYRGWREVRAVSTTHPNKPMHPTADTRDVINLQLAGRRVIGGVRLLLRIELSAE